MNTLHPALSRLTKLPAEPSVAPFFAEALRRVLTWKELKIDQVDKTKPASHFIAIHQRRIDNPYVDLSGVEGMAESLDSLKRISAEAPVHLTLVDSACGGITIFEACGMVVGCMLHKPQGT